MSPDQSSSIIDTKDLKKQLTQLVFCNSNPSNTMNLKECLDFSADYNSSLSSPVETTSYDRDQIKKSMKLLSLFLFPIASLTCIIGNLLVIYVVIKIRRMRQSYTNFFLFNMAIADFGVGLICIIPTFIDFYEPQWLWRLGPVVCKLNYYTQLVSYTASVLILLIITIERYLAIIFPMRIRIMKSKLGYILAVSGVWILSLTFALPNFFEYNSVVSTTSLNPAFYIDSNDSLLQQPTPSCSRMYRVNMKVYHMATFLVLYVIPLTIMSTLYGKIALVLWRSTRQLRMEVKESNLTSSASPLKSNGCANSPYSRCSGDQGHYQSLMRMKRLHGAAEQSYDYESSDSPIKGGKASGSTGEPSMTIADPGNAAVAAQRYACRIQRSNKTLRARKRVIAMLVTVVLTFMVCKLPRHIWLFILYHGSDSVAQNTSLEVTYLLPPFSYLAMYLSSAINPIIYFTFSENFRRSMQTALCLRCHRCRQQDNNSRPVANRKSMTPGAAHAVLTSRP